MNFRKIEGSVLPFFLLFIYFYVNTIITCVSSLGLAQLPGPGHLAVAGALYGLWILYLNGKELTTKQLRFNDFSFDLLADWNATFSLNPSTATHVPFSLQFQIYPYLHCIVFFFYFF